MKITRIRGFHVTIPLAVPYKLSRVYGTVSDAHAVVVAVETDKGIVGYGEADPHPPFTDDTVGGTIEAIKVTLGPNLVGADPRDFAQAERVMDGALAGHLMAKGALDMALHDIAGKAEGVPVHELLGRKRNDAILLSFPLGSGTAGEDMEVIEQRRSLGFRSFMAKMGRNPIPDEIARVAQLSEKYDGKVHLVADANQGWQEHEALEFVSGAADTFLSLIEQPLAAAEKAGLKRIREVSRVPVSADESVVTEQDASELAHMEAVDVFSVKASKNGGITKAARIMKIAQSAGIACRMNSMLEFGITQAALLHLGAVAGNLIPSGHAYMSTLRMADDFTDFRDTLGDGYAHVMDKPGLGVNVDEEKLARYSLARFTI